MSENNITRIQGLRTLNNLETLDLSHNIIENTKHLADTTSLNKLILSHNNIDTCPNLVKNKHLQVLDLGYNKIRTTFNMNECLPNRIKSLYLGYNKITDLLAPLFLLFFDSTDDVDFSGNPFIEYMKEEK